MADEAVQNDEETGSKRPRLMLILGLVGALGIGAGGGVALVGPAVAERLSRPPAEESAEADHGGGHGAGAEGAGSSFVVENLVLNPAETKGTRFLMATVVASLEDAKAIAVLQAREPEVRDRLMALLGSKTVDDLSDVAQRDALKQEIRLSLSEIVAPAQVQAVFLPTFVIQ